MRILQFSQYATAKQGRLVGDAIDDLGPEAEFVGVAIGPRSDEARVMVDGELLEAGRILPLRNRRFAIERATPYDDQLACISYLELMLFEDLHELVVDVARPKGRYSESATFAGLHAFSVPFVGRRQAKFLITGTTANLTYTLFGVQYSQALRAVKLHPLKTVAAAAWSVNGTYSFYLGGTDNGEEWDALALQISNGEAAATFTVDVTTIGELGAR